MKNFEKIKLPKDADLYSYVKQEFVRKEQLRKIGEGCYATVYGSPKVDYVYKVFEDDFAYLKYLKFVIKKGQNNPHVPRIYKMYKIATKERSIYVVKVERLKKVKCAKSVNLRNGLELYAAGSKIQEVSSNPNLKQIGKFLRKYSVGGWSSTIDLHPENVMIRPSTSELVVIDPLC